MSNATVTIMNNKLIVEIDLDAPRPSSSGKTLLIAGTGGFQRTGVEHQGKEISVNLTATVKP